MPFESSISAPYHSERQAMVENQLRRRGINDPRVLEAMLRVPRHEFVPETYRSQAYEDHPIPIGEEQTISQPFIVALSLQALSLNGSERVLEVGTGSGYQTALLASLAASVFSMERHRSLAMTAQSTLTRLQYYNVHLAVGDGTQGWPEHAPYQAMLISAAAPAVPQSLLTQLSNRGKMVIPVGPPHAQQLQLVVKSDAGYLTQNIEGCRFVPLVGAEGY